MDVDCYIGIAEQPVELLSGTEWYAKTKQRLAEDIDYHLREHGKEVERVERNNLWLRLLRESLAGTKALEAQRHG